MADEFVRIEGLAEFRKGLRAASADLPKALTEAHRRVARVVVDAAGSKLTSTHGKRQGAVTISASGTQGGAFIRLRGPAAFGAEFGSNRYKQFKPHLGRKGYAVYPTIREKHGEINAMYLDAVDEAVTRRAFPQ